MASMQLYSHQQPPCRPTRLFASLLLGFTIGTTPLVMAQSIDDLFGGPPPAPKRSTPKPATPLPAAVPQEKAAPPTPVEPAASAPVLPVSPVAEPEAAPLPVLGEAPAKAEPAPLVSSVRLPASIKAFSRLRDISRISVANARSRRSPDASSGMLS